MHKKKTENFILCNFKWLYRDICFSQSRKKTHLKNIQKDRTQQYTLEHVAYTINRFLYIVVNTIIIQIQLIEKGILVVRSVKTLAKWSVFFFLKNKTKNCLNEISFLVVEFCLFFFHCLQIENISKFYHSTKII